MNSRVIRKSGQIKILLILLIAIYASGYVNGQSIARWVITPLGNQYDNNFQIIQATTGEPNIITVTDSSTFYLTQGFQQPSSSDLPDEDYKITIVVYPNPVRTSVAIKFYVKDVDDFTIDVRDVVGKLILSDKVHDVYSGQVTFLDFSQFSQGLYFVHIYSAGDEMTIVEKIIKL